MLAFSKNQLDSMALGASLLGSGGGGNPKYSVLTANHLLTNSPVNLLSLNELDDNDLVVPIGFMGAPLVGLEKLRSQLELETIIRLIEKDLGRMPSALSVTEIGGSNAFTPFYIAGKLGLPIVDADLIGRAFPELQMITTSVHGVKPNACYMSDSFGNTVTLRCSDLKTVEKYARQMTVSFGSSAAIVLHVLTGKEAKKVMINGSISTACALGKAIQKARAEHTRPIDEIMKHAEGSTWLGSGTIVDIDQYIESGFLQGTVTIQGSKPLPWLIKFQNEYLFVEYDKNNIAATPDIIALLDAETGTPITSESLSYGLRVDILILKSPAIWYSKPGLEIVGPSAFQTFNREDAHV
ncbi:MAG: DUF917 domain-containing protein [Legionella sp.]|nr:DUF917 domain-containing protein [Legionella sp.]